VNYVFDRIRIATAGISIVTVSRVNPVGLGEPETPLLSYRDELPFDKGVFPWGAGSFFGGADERQ
jgi:hypothetical protein